MSTPSALAVSKPSPAPPALDISKSSLTLMNESHHSASSSTSSTGTTVSELTMTGFSSNGCHGKAAFGTSCGFDFVADCCSPVTTVVSEYHQEGHAVHEESKRKVTNITSSALHNVHDVIEIINQPMVPKFITIEDKYTSLAVKLFRVRIIECQQSLETASVTTSTWLKAVAEIRIKAEADFIFVKRSIDETAVLIKANGERIKQSIEAIKCAVAEMEYESFMMKDVSGNVVKETKEHIKTTTFCFVSSWTEAIATSLVVATLAGDCCHIKHADVLTTHAALLRSLRLEGVRLEAKMTSLVYQHGLFETQLMRLEADIKFVTSRKIEVEHSLKALSLLTTSCDVGKQAPPPTPSPPYTPKASKCLKECQDVKIVGKDNNILQATCITTTGVSRTASLNLDTGLGNIEGVFDYTKESFSQSAHSITLKGTVLSAQLKTTKNEWKAAHTDLDLSVTVIDGNLVFVRRVTPFLKDCTNIKLIDNHTLQADCLTKSGKKTSTINLDDGLGNIEGSFDWKKQMFSHSAQAITLKGTVLSAKLRPSSGEPKDASTDLNLHIVNNDGKLEFKK